MNRFLRKPKSDDLEMESKMQLLGEENAGDVSALDATANEAEGGTDEEMESGRYAGGGFYGHGSMKILSEFSPNTEDTFTQDTLL